MNILFVYAHDDPESFGAAIHNRALGFLERQQHKCVVSDLYGSGFHAVAAKWDFKISSGAHEEYTIEQKRAAADDGAGFAEDIKDQIAKLRAADLVIFEFPLRWSGPSAIMKGWFDKVFAQGVVWDSDHRYSTGLLGGKQALVITQTDDSEQLYSTDGLHKATVEQHLYPLLHSTLAHAGMDVHKPFVTSGLATATDNERQAELDRLQSFMQSMLENPTFLYKH